MIKSKEQVKKEFDEKFPASFFFRGADRVPLRDFINNIREQDKKDLIAEIESGLRNVAFYSRSHEIPKLVDIKEVLELLSKYK